jgi:uracil-DNA glycosylase
MIEKYYFPFGQELKKVEQKDKTPKKAFVLGVYASAIHAKWIDKDGKQKVSALAVASEPEIFWTGDNAEKIISTIKIHDQLGELSLPSDKKLNGPSGRALDKLFLTPLRLDRNATWLCDLLPFSRVNEKQRQAINKHYTDEIINKFNLTEANIPDFDKAELNSQTRREEILNELETSQAETLILLGDLPIYWFLRFHDNRFSKLSQFGETKDTYGKRHELKINNKIYNVIPLCHPRQADRLGSSSTKWRNLHGNWIKQRNANKL